MRTVSGLFDNRDDARNAVAQLEAVGVPSSDISLIANNVDNRYSDSDTSAAEGAGAGASLGAAGGGAVGLLTGLGLMAIPGVGPVVAAGWLASTAAGAVAGGAVGGMIGAITNSGISESDAHVYAEGVRRGGSVVIARIDEGLVADAEAILRANSVDPVGRRQAYAEAGWQRFDDRAAPYSASEIEEERRRYTRIP